MFRFTVCRKGVMPPVPLDRKKDFAKDMEPHLRCGSSGKNMPSQLHKREQNAIRIPGEASRRPFQGGYKRYPLIGLGQTTCSTGGLTCEKALCRQFRWTEKRILQKTRSHICDVAPVRRTCHRNCTSANRTQLESPGKHPGARSRAVTRDIP